MQGYLFYVLVNRLHGLKGDGFSSELPARSQRSPASGCSTHNSHSPGEAAGGRPGGGEEAPLPGPQQPLAARRPGPRPDGLSPVCPSTGIASLPKDGPPSQASWGTAAGRWGRPAGPQDRNTAAEPEKHLRRDSSRLEHSEPRVRVGLLLLCFHLCVCNTQLWRLLNGWLLSFFPPVFSFSSLGPGNCKKRIALERIILLLKFSLWTNCVLREFPNYNPRLPSKWDCMVWFVSYWSLD